MPAQVDLCTCPPIESGWLTRLTRPGSAPEDAALVQLISAFWDPRPDWPEIRSAEGQAAAWSLVGILNADGKVYREVRLRGALEILHFHARMNAAGFSEVSPRGHRGDRQAKYVLLFEKTSPGRLRERSSAICRR
jgi:hypothetical protein